MNARALSVNLCQAAKETYCPAAKMSKQAKTLPILSHARIFTHDGHIVIQSVDTSGEKWELLASLSPAAVDADFDICVPMRPLRDWLSVTAKYKSVLELSIESNTLTIIERYGEGGKKLPCASRARFNCMSADDFPSNLPLKGITQ